MRDKNKEKSLCSHCFHKQGKDFEERHKGTIREEILF